jgi:Xaa-Pro aminopeptidase
MLMKQDLDRLMQERGLDALVVAGKMLGNPALYYMVNGANTGWGIVVQVRGREAVFVCSPIEREEAVASGLTVLTSNRYDYRELLDEQPDMLLAQVELYRRIFADLEVRGKVGFYGKEDQGSAWLLLNALDRELAGVEVYGEYEQSLIDIARATKDAGEAERIREVGRRTADIVGQTLEFLQSHSAREGALVQADGTPLTLGRVHQEIGRFVAEQRLECPEGFIFAIGRDAGIPHNTGNAEDMVELGKTIIFDLFPCEAGGGYYFDMTRTFCLGFAPPEVEKAYRDVYDCVQMLAGAYEVGSGARRYQQMTCEFFEGQGHPTVASDPKTETGYVHSLGHGIGLAVHEEPFFADIPANTSVLEPGHIFTCEPGLYYPERGFGLRIEDVFWIDAGGTVQNLTDFTKELVVKV